MIKTLIATIALLSSVTVEAKTVIVNGTTGEQSREMAYRRARREALSAAPVEAKDIHLDANCVRESETFNIGYTCQWQVVYETEDKK